MNNRDIKVLELKYMALRERFGTEIARLQDEVASLRAELTCLHEDQNGGGENVVQ
jgi:hypothetical protein